jgi:Zn-dependent protease
VPDIDLTHLLIGLSVLLLSLSVHEAAHAWSADRLGDTTARRLGRVSLNPVVHIDPVGTLLFPLLAIVSNLPILGWAKPVPVNTANLREPWRRPYMLIAAAGPASNLLLAAGAAIVVRMLGFETFGSDLMGWVFRFLLLMVTINVLLAVFNMLPVPPLDGGNVLAGLLPPAGAAVVDRVRPFGIFILYGLLLTGALWTLVGPLHAGIVGWLLR